MVASQRRSPRRSAAVLAAVFLAVSAAAPPAAADPGAAGPEAAPTSSAARTAASWHIENLGNPVPGGRGGEVVGAVAIANGIVPQDPYIFNIVSGKLYVTYLSGDKWEWIPLGTPPGTEVIRTSIGVVAGQQRFGEAERPFAFVQGADGGLWAMSRSSSGYGWSWESLGVPEGTTVSEGVGAVAIHDSPASYGRPYIYVIGADGTLRLCWWNGRSWAWLNLGVPPNAMPRAVTSGVGVTSTQPVTEGAEYPQAFVVSGREMWRNGWDGRRFTWVNHGSPTPAGLPRGLGALNDNSTAYRTTYIAAYVAVNNYVYGFTLDNNGDGEWLDHGGLDRETYVVTAGVVTVQADYGESPVPHVFVIRGHGGPISVNWRGSGGWTWAELEGTDPNPLRGDAVSARRDIDTGAEVPYVFYWSAIGDDLMVDWLG